MSLFAHRRFEEKRALVVDEARFSLFFRGLEYANGESVLHAFGLRNESSGAVLFYDAPAMTPEKPGRCFKTGEFDRAYLELIAGNLSEAYALPRALKVFLGLEEPAAEPVKRPVQARLAL